MIDKNIVDKLEKAIEKAKALPYNMGYYSGLVLLLQDILDDIKDDAFFWA